MAPTKLIILPQGGTPIEVLFNPNSYTVDKSVAWTPSTQTTTGGATTDVKANAPTTAFGGGGSRRLSLELFFDSTETDIVARDVRLQTDQIVRLTRIERKNGRPPVCVVLWGPAKTEDFPFVGTISSLSQRFVLFDQIGRPLRALLNVTFTEFLNRDDDERLTDPETTTRIVRRGDSLASIAAEVYRDAAEWRVIATANGIEDPFVLPAGRKLTLPKQ
ncbi:MAG: LysM peptidoglycan-binding domain-containing protein [bacterium]